MVEEQVVGELVAVVRALAVAGVVVADGREERDTVEGVAVGLVEARVPLVVLVAGARGVLVAEVDVVAGGDHQPDVARVDRPLERTRDEQLAGAVEAPVDDPDPEVAEHGEADGRVRLDRRERPEAVVVPTAGLHQRRLLDAPVMQLALAPRPAVDGHAIAVLRVRLETREPRVVVLVGLRARSDAAVPDYFDDGVPERLRARTDRLAARARSNRRQLLVVDDPPLAVRRITAPEVEATPRDQGLVVTETREMQELLEVHLEVRHQWSVPHASRAHRRVDAGTRWQSRRGSFLLTLHAWWLQPSQADIQLAVCSPFG